VAAILMVFGLILVGVLTWYLVPVVIHLIRFVVDFPR